MNCNIIKDLIPLYIDNCCSEESVRAVEEHIAACPQCKVTYESMSSEMGSPVAAPTKFNRINEWKASVLQSVLFFLSFAIITVGVALEAATPSGFSNGLWAFRIVVPATGFMLSLGNWYFVKVYKSRKSFSNWSCLATFGITICAYIWACVHYEMDIFGFIVSGVRNNISVIDFLEMLIIPTIFYGTGILVMIVLCVCSKIFSNQYAKMLGKE